jgi:hypothetical protein
MGKHDDEKTKTEEDDKDKRGRTTSNDTGGKSVSDNSKKR